MSSARTVRLNIITPDETVFSGEASFIVARSVGGELGILPKHAPMVAALSIWPLRVDTADGGAHYFAVFGGFMDVQPDEVTIVTPNCEVPASIDVDRAQRAKERAEKRLKERSEDIDIDRARLALARALMRLDVAKYK